MAAAPQAGTNEMPRADLAGMAGMQKADAGSTGHDCPPVSAHVHDPVSGEPDSDCPFGPAGGLDCALLASFPAAATGVSEPGPISEAGGRATTILRCDRHSATIFHPPKA